MKLIVVLISCLLYKCTLAQKECIQDNIDLWGGDIRSFRTINKNLTQCMESCLNEWACQAFTYIKNSGHCYIKNNKHRDPKRCTNCISGQSNCFVDHKRYAKTTLENVALNKEVKISSTRTNHGGDARRAIDNSTNTRWDDRSCTYSSHNGLNYLQLDLDKIYQIDHIMLYTRSDREQDRLNGAKLYIGGQLCQKLSDMDKSPEHGHKITCGDNPKKRVGKKIWIERLAGTITVCELQVWVDPKTNLDEIATEEVLLHEPEEVGDFYNVAYRKTAEQTSRHGSSTANKAVDGYIEQRYNSGSSGSCSCTHNRASPETWSVDLGKVYQIDHIRVYGRNDGSQERLKDVRVMIGESICGKLSGVKTGFEDIKCQKEYMAGRYVKLMNNREYLTLCEVQVLVKKSDINMEPTIQVNPGETIGDFTNVAIFKNAKQSSEGWGGHPSKAIDGVTEGNYGRGSCTHTHRNGNSQWMVDLGKPYTIDHIVIYGRSDGHSERLNGARVRVGRTIVGYLTVPKKTSDPMKVSVTNATSTVVGRRVYVELLNNYLTLCEVQVMVKNEDLSDEPGTATPGWENAALGMPTNQSSDAHGGSSNRAVDGWPAASHWNMGSCTHTGYQPINWWEVNLGKEVYIDHIKLTGRSDAAQERLEHAVVLIDGQLVGSLPYEKRKQHYFVMPMNNIKGRKIRVRLRKEPLTICEFEVMVNNNYEPDDEEEKDPLKNGKSNLAVEGSASTTGHVFGGSPDLALDGNTDADFFRGSCTFSGPAQGDNWWKVELKKISIVGMIYIYPRLDKYTYETIGGATVKVGDHTCGTIGYQAGKRFYSVDCNKAKGDFVQISKPGWISICEVVVNAA